MSLRGKTLFISGASRGIGLAIAVRAAKDGANIAIAAKSDQPNPKLPGTIHTAAEAIEAAGGKALPMQVDIRDENAVAAAVKKTADHFGSVDILVNNASAISLSGTLDTPMKRFDLMFGVNVRGTFVCSQACVPYLKESAKAGRQPHILNLSPPLSMKPRWFGPHVAYTMAKYGMSMCVLGMAEEFRADGIGVNALWPRTVIATAALNVIALADPKKGRKPEIMADAAHVILTRDPRSCTGNFFIDDEVLASAGTKDLDQYAVTPGNQQFQPDFFVD
ncbi:short chain dehydrogenase [Steroidobacter agaridevorans]|uniref:Short chain dehydrogenase n=1 Tax=Steroidobacter agaridevorans TaxID=2695856 RepID=A0A829Y798_9GAMM|nr:NAD(P)-dependent oxidoreductase [Steroidobacter agaridevorans]GFE78492.1 short chain dehydrogenase [Steroidobacter agaridevorans]